MTVLRGVLAAGVLAFASAACAGLIGADPPDLFEPAPDVDSGTADAGPVIVDDASGTVDSGAPPKQVDVAHGIFVSAHSGADGPSCGAITAPCATIQAGIDSFQAIGASAGKTTVYVASATYTETITLASGVIVEGGWDEINNAWRSSAPGTHTVVAATTNAKTVIAESLVQTATLRGLTIRSKSPADVGESLYGVFARGDGASATPMLRLESVTIEIEAGGAGRDGDASTGTGAPSYFPCPTSDDGGAGNTGTTGSGAEAGSFSSDGYVAANGGAGGTGSGGREGTAGGAGETKTCAYCVGPGTCKIMNGDFQGFPGSPGCGGGGGPGGGGGRGGGSSVGVFVWGVTVEISGARVASGNGGAGGAGGSGGNGGPGAEGVAGDQKICGPEIMQACSGCNLTYEYLQGGAAGGTGGTGGKGGYGGSGAGGASCALFVGDGGAFMIPSTTLAHGSGGASANGAVGLAADVCP